MRGGQLDNVLHHLRSLAAARQTSELSDPELLERFVTSHDQTAFAAIVERHGPLLLGVCRRILRNEHDAQDACQATFLVLVRKAPTIRKREALGSWLHGVACRTAQKLHGEIRRRAAQDVTDTEVALPDTTNEITWREGLAVLDEELHRLPATYRSALVLCYLEGRTHDQAARELGCSVGALCGRLVRARESLRRRLLRRGVSLSAALLGTLLVLSQATAALPPTLAVRTIKAATALVTGVPLASVVPAKVATLTQGVLTAMFVTKLKTTVVLALIASLLVVAAGALAQGARSERATPVAKQAIPLSPEPPPAADPRAQRAASPEKADLALADEGKAQKASSPQEGSFPTAGPAKLDLAGISKGVRATEEAWQSQKSWLLRYKHTRDWIEEPGAVEWQPAEMTQARKGKWFLSHWAASKDFNQWYVWKDGEYTWQTAENDPRKGTLDDLRQGGLFSTLWYPANLFLEIWHDGLPRFRDLGIDDPFVHLPRELEDEKAKYEVRTQQEKIDGYPCHVIERKGKYTFWIDPAHGFMVRKAYKYSATGRLVVEYKSSHFREKVKGIWLPERQVLVSYYDDNDFDKRRKVPAGKVARIVTNSLLEARFNDVPDEFFAIPKSQRREK
jgi:RNA polymerase sigma factor (sigma-70 family)